MTVGGIRLLKFKTLYQSPDRSRAEKKKCQRIFQVSTKKNSGMVVRFGCLFTRKQGLGWYSPGADYSQAGGWTTGYPLITPGSSRGVPKKVSSLLYIRVMSPTYYESCLLLPFFFPEKRRNLSNPINWRRCFLRNLFFVANRRIQKANILLCLDIITNPLRSRKWRQGPREHIKYDVCTKNALLIQMKRFFRVEKVGLLIN